MSKLLIPYERTQQNNLKQLAHHIQNLLQQKGVDRKQYLQSMVVVADQFQTHLIVLGPKGTSEPIVASPDVPWQALLEQTEIKRVYRGEEVILRGKLDFRRGERVRSLLFRLPSLFLMKK